MASALTTSARPPRSAIASARSSDRALFPVPVAPARTTNTAPALELEATSSRAQRGEPERHGTAARLRRHGAGCRFPQVPGIAGAGALEAERLPRRHIGEQVGRGGSG